MAGITLGFGRERALAVVDIGSGFVGCAIIALSAKGRARVIAHARSTLTLEDRTALQARSRVGEEIAEAAKRAHDEASRVAPRLVIDTVYIVLHAPWTTSKTIRSNQHFETETAIRASHIESLSKSALSKEEADHGNLLEAAVLAVRLNGYPTRTPEGEHARELEVTSMVSACDAEMKTTALSAVQMAFPTAKIAWRSAARVSADVLMHMKDTASTLVVSMGVLATHVMVLRDGIPVEEKVVDEGMRSILARVHEKRSPEETLSLFRMLARDACTDEACLSLEKAIAAAEPDLVRVFGEVFGGFVHEKRLPNSMIVIAHQDLLRWFGNFLGRIDFTQFTVTTMPFSVTPLDCAHMSAWIECDGTLDPVLALGCAHAVLEEQST